MAGDRQLLSLSWVMALMFSSGSSASEVTINGAWSTWSRVQTECVRLNSSSGQQKVVTCGGGVNKRFRSCTNPTSQGFMGKECPGSSESVGRCNTQPCNTIWSAWSPCSVRCGRGFRKAVSLCSSDPDGEPRPCAQSGFADHDFEYVQECNTWNKTTCSSPCSGYECPDFSMCIDTSDEKDPSLVCECQMGRKMDSKNSTCEIRLAEGPTPRPIPVLPKGVKVVTSAVTRSASTLLVILVGITLFLFGSLKVFDVARVIQMNMEIALILAHLCLLFPSDPANVLECKVVSILTHFFFTTCFAFMLLEAVHVYSLVAFVVSANGLLGRLQNTLVGWGLTLGVVMLTVGLRYEDYGGDYHCWLRIDSPLFYAQLAPMVTLVVLTFAMTEAAGSANFKALDKDLGKTKMDTMMDRKQLMSAKIMQRTNIVIMPIVLASFFTGSFAEYDQSVALYGTFTIINGCLGGCILVMHSSCNERVRDILAKVCVRILRKE